LIWYKLLGVNDESFDVKKQVQNGSRPIFLRENKSQQNNVMQINISTHLQ